MKTTHKPILFGLAALLSAPVTLPAAVNMILAVQDIPGESMITGYTGSIDVLDFSWGATKSAADYPKLGKTILQSLYITKWVDSSSPRLLRAAAKGLSIPTITLYVEKGGSASSPNYLQITLQNVVVRSVITGGSGGQDRLTETVTFDFEQLWTTYTPQLPNGSAESPIQYAWNAVTQRPVETSEPHVTPPSIHDFGVGVKWVNGSPTANLSWQAFAGQKFRVLFTPDIATTPFVLYGIFTAETDGSHAIDIPANTATGFFRIELSP